MANGDTPDQNVGDRGTSDKGITSPERGQSLNPGQKARSEPQVTRLPYVPPKLSPEERITARPKLSPEQRLTHDLPLAVEDVPKGRLNLRDQPPSRFLQLTKKLGTLAHDHAEQLIPPEVLPRGLRGEPLPREHPLLVEFKSKHGRDIKRRIDRVDFQNRVIYEIKPRDKRDPFKSLERYQEGLEQAKIYRAYLSQQPEHAPPPKWTIKVITYDVDKAIDFFGRRYDLLPEEVDEINRGRKVGRVNRFRKAEKLEKANRLKSPRTIADSSVSNEPRGAKFRPQSNVKSGKRRATRVRKPGPGIGGFTTLGGFVISTIIGLAGSLLLEFGLDSLAKDLEGLNVPKEFDVEKILHLWKSDEARLALSQQSSLNENLPIFQKEINEYYSAEILELEHNWLEYQSIAADLSLEERRDLTDELVASAESRLSDLTTVQSNVMQFFNFEQQHLQTAKEAGELAALVVPVLSVASGGMITVHPEQQLDIKNFLQNIAVGNVRLFEQLHELDGITDALADSLDSLLSEIRKEFWTVALELAKREVREREDERKAKETITDQQRALAD